MNLPFVGEFKNREGAVIYYELAGYSVESFRSTDFITVMDGHPGSILVFQGDSGVTVQRKPF
jgi:hypothetical protein